MTVILLRHGRSLANTARTLAGRSAGVPLDDLGFVQAERVAARLATMPIRAIVRSPLLRCRQTVAPLAGMLGLDPVLDDRLSEVDYGTWTGRALAELVEESLWPVVQQHPAAVAFPGGESLAQVQARAVASIREHDRRLTEIHGGDVLWVACSHGDVIKSVVADAAGAHLDAFQRIVVEPASLSVLRYTTTRPFVLRVNDTGPDLGSLHADAPAHLRDGEPIGAESDAPPGGAL